MTMNEFLRRPLTEMSLAKQRPSYYSPFTPAVLYSHRQEDHTAVPVRPIDYRYDTIRLSLCRYRTSGPAETVRRDCRYDNEESNR